MIISRKLKDRQCNDQKKKTNGQWSTKHYSVLGLCLHVVTLFKKCPDFLSVYIYRLFPLLFCFNMYLYCPWFVHTYYHLTQFYAEYMSVVYFQTICSFFLLFCFVLICVCTVLCLCIRIVTLLNSLFGHGHAWCLSYICCEKMRYKIWVRVMVFNATFNNYLSYIVAVSFIGGGNQSALSKPSTCHKSLTICMS